MLRVETLPIKKAEYNKIEKKLIKSFGCWSTFIYIIFFAACIVISAWKPSICYTLIFLQLLLCLISLQIHLQYYFVSGCNLLWKMYKFHRFEFYNHRNRKISLLLSTFLSGFILYIITLSGFYLTYC